MTPDLAIDCRNLTKRYKSRSGVVDAVNGLDLQVRSGECFGLLGPNGAGKTTTIEILEGLLAQTSGEVEVLGRHWGEHDDELRQRIGISLQETRLSEKLSVRETLVLFRSFYRSGKEPEATMDACQSRREGARHGSANSRGGSAAAGGCLRAGRRSGSAVSGRADHGTRSAVAPAAVGHYPRAQGEGRTMLITTHYMDEAERLCDRVAIVDHGKVIALGSPSELIASLGGEHVIEFAVADGAGPSTADYGSLPSVREVRSDGPAISLTVGEPHVAVPALLARLQSRGQELTRLTTRHVSLEDVFVHLTGRHLRDDEVSPS